MGSYYAVVNSEGQFKATQGQSVWFQPRCVGWVQIYDTPAEARRAASIGEGVIKVVSAYVPAQGAEIEIKR